MTTILLVDDQAMIRVGLRTILDSQDDLTVVGEAGDGFEALEALRTTPVDVVLLDIRMPGIDGVETTRRIRATFTAEQTRIIILTTFEHDDIVVAALRAGANGFLGKTVGPSELVAGIREVVLGGGALSAAAQAAVISQVAAQPARTVDPDVLARFDALTPRERDVVVAIAHGADNEEIGRTMFVSPFTVKTHANRAMAKLGARDRAQLVSLAYRAGLVD
ncbi:MULTISPECIES: response regulator transcription factor [unclassified Curtobacterium]|uniref:response regulator transcription factor n=1 Tax=unclassified Curtobacterium TaxID=257496 RepID=UPI000D986787|nr:MULTISPECIES: response regulator transcription factor [unclassified Curtobacterium]PYY65716.1 DNA-binding response regulator [Curtobacterium sp. MCPF17_003]PZE73098.1 DNA-binding response regulator [Curtobacterium sp. MCPF17_018]WIB71186.1 response regulator transcription factor [Curtobacterium sp. MCBD17_026]